MERNARSRLGARREQLKEHRVKQRKSSRIVRKRREKGKVSEGGGGIR